MRPLDPRLLRYARSTRVFVAIAVVLGAITAALVIAQARLLSTVIVDVAQGRADLSSSASLIGILACVLASRALVAWIAEATAYRSSARAKEQLRESALEHVLDGRRLDTGELATLTTRGIDALDAYFARYLPQLILAVIVPVAVLLTILGQDLLSTLIIAVTLPLIPVFMALVGLYTRARVDRQWTTLARLSGHFLDLVSGLPTLKAFGRAQAQLQAIRNIGDRYRSTTMGVLRISFLSSLVLELLASVSVALVAVSIGLRLAEGAIGFEVALFILLLAPEAYLPLRLVGQHFHAAAEGLGAAERMFEILEGQSVALPQRAGTTIDLESVSVTYPTRDQPSLLPTTFRAQPGDVVALVGPSGGGKSTLLDVILGFVEPTSGIVHACPPREAIAWLPQSPTLIAPGTAEPTIADAVRLGRPQATDDDVRIALSEAGVGADIAALPEGVHTRLGIDGSGLSAGQRRRVALARALLMDAPVLLLDEPTAALDGVSEDAVVTVIRAAAQRGVTVVVVAHRPAVLDVATAIVHVGGVATAEPVAAVEISSPALSAGW